jgi:hypothetical protein
MAYDALVRNPMLDELLQSIDWHIVKAQYSQRGSCWHDAGGSVIAKPGGIRLLRHFVNTCLDCDIIPNMDEESGVASFAAACIRGEAIPQTMALCDFFREEEAQSKDKVIRITDLCGFRPAQIQQPLLEECPCDSSPCAVVIDDANLGIRSQVNKVLEVLSAIIKGDGTVSPWIILN